jgi:hypothetical protein
MPKILSMAALCQARHIGSRGITTCKSKWTTPSDRQMYFIYALDKTDEGTFQCPLAMRPKHLGQSEKLFDTGCTGCNYRLVCLAESVSGLLTFLS